MFFRNPPRLIQTDAFFRTHRITWNKSGHLFGIIAMLIYNAHEKIFCSDLTQFICCRFGNNHE